jgi:exoribonuclease R
MNEKVIIHNNIRFRTNDNNYDEWFIYDSTSLNELSKEDYHIDPIKLKLFNQDTFRYFSDGSIEILYSSLRNMPIIPGVLLLDKQYGYYKDKILYKFRPDDRRTPYFLVPYKIKKIGFSKNIKNKFVIIKFINWEFKHPYGQIVNTIGDVDILENFYEYQLYCKSLNASIQMFNKNAIEKLRLTSESQYIEKILEKFPSIEDRTNEIIITIDPKNTRDIDDAFSIKDSIYHNKPVQIFSIYIANVAIWMDTLDLWSSFSNRISTIYLPDRKRPMLPSIISDGLCSLVEKNNRFAFTLDIFIYDNDIVHYEFKNTLVNIFKNYNYNEPSLKKDNIYIKSLEVISKLSQKIRYVDIVKNSHDFISYIMILMNYITAKEFQKLSCGIFRTAKINSEYVSKIPDTLPKKMIKLLTQWNSTGGYYTCIDNNTSEELKNKIFDTKHDILKLDTYVHITSPIRRLVDLLNIIKIQEKMDIIELSSKSNDFYNKWCNNDSIEYINTTMRSIRKLQGDCEILQLCNDKPEHLKQKFKGYVFDRIHRVDGLYQYTVYLPELYMIHRHTTRYYHENYTYNNYKLYIFNNEFNFKKKILLGYYE